MHIRNQIILISSILLITACSNEKAEQAELKAQAELASIKANNEAAKKVKIKNELAAAHREFNEFVQNNSKDGVFSMVRDTSFLANIIKGGFSKSIDIQQAVAEPYKNTDIRLTCTKAHCTNAVYYKNGRINELVKVTDPNSQAFYISFKNKALRNEALAMLSKLPKAEGTDPDIYYSILRKYPLVRTTQQPKLQTTNFKKASYVIVNSETNSSDRNIVTTFISCSNGKTKVVTTNESISFYADSSGQRHSNLNDAALASCN